MAIKQVKLKTYPKALPDDVEVRDFDLGGGKFARVIMEAKREFMHGEEHFVLQAQAYEMDKNGNMIQAPLGYPSRCASSSHTAQASALGTTIELDDAWVEVAIEFNPEEPGDVKVQKAKPTKPGTKYGDTVWSTNDVKAYRWTEGFADIVARTKVNDLLTVLKTSALRSGFAFRNRTK